MELLLEGRYDRTLQMQDAYCGLQLRLGHDSEGTVLIRIENGVEKMDLDVQADPDAACRILLYKEGDKDLELNVRSTIDSDAKVRMGYLDIEHASVNMNLHADLVAQGADYEIYTAMLADAEGRKKCEMEVSHHADHTYGNMHNFAVLYDKGDYEMAASGRIDKGAFGSESHQETRVLTLGHDHQAKVLPILYIDENDVKASHAMTVGQPDADQLYYLESRGLSARSAMSLLAIGYFMPVIELAPDERLRQDLQTELERKAGLYGH